MDLQQFLGILRTRWLLMLVTLLITVGTTIAVSLILPPCYTATAIVVADFKGVDPITGGIIPLLPMSGYLATRVDVIKSRRVARLVS